MTQTIASGAIEIRPLERVLLVDQQPVSVRAQAFDVLLALMQRSDRVVSKQELLELAWNGRVVEEGNIAVQISALRRVLGPASIVNVAGRGYRFLASDAHAADQLDGAHEGHNANGVVRRLATVVFADLPDWADTLAAHPQTASAAWAAQRQGLIEPSLRQGNGRTLDVSTAGIAVEFSSTVEALTWTLDLRQRLSEWPAAPAAPRLLLRFALHVDDVIVDDGKLVGDMLTIVSRMLDGVAANQIVLSEPVRQMVGNKVSAQFKPLGMVKLRADDFEPTALYAAVAPLPTGSPQAAQPHLLWERRPSLAVLPFATDSADDRYFGDGMTEEIIALLSANRSLFVIARNSTLRYSNSTATPGEIAAELGVRYLLTGSVRHAGKRLRIMAQLLEAGPGRVLWSDREEGAHEELFSFQTRMATSIAAAIDPRLQAAEIERACSRPTGNMSAYDHVLRGLSLLYTFAEGDFDMAGQHFKQAIELDPRYAQAHSHLAWWHNLRFGEARSPKLNEDGRQAEAMSRRALELDPMDALSLSVAGHIQSFMKRNFTVAMDMFDQALQINPSCAVAWSRSGTTLAYLGRGEEALQRVRNALRLSPFDPLRFSFYTTNGTANLALARYDEAVGWLAKARRMNPGYRAALRLLVAALALAGDRVEAEAHAQALLQQEPRFRVSNFVAWYPLREHHLSRLAEGLRAAGLPD